MIAEDLFVGDKVMYQDTEERCMATVISIDPEKEIIHFKDWEDFEWEEEFKYIPETVIKKL